MNWVDVTGHIFDWSVFEHIYGSILKRIMHVFLANVIQSLRGVQQERMCTTENKLNVAITFTQLEILPTMFNTWKNRLWSVF